MQEQQLQDKVKLEVKLEETIANLPSRHYSHCNPTESYRVLTNMVQIQNHQATNPVVHIYSIEIAPAIQEQRILDYIHQRLKESVKQYTYLKKGNIMTSEQFTKDKRMIKLVYDCKPIEVWLSHKASLRFGKTFNGLAFCRGNHYLKAILAQQLRELNFTYSKDKKSFYIPRLEGFNGLQYRTLNYVSTSFNWCDNRMFLMVKQRSKIIEEGSVLNAIKDFYSASSHLTKQEKRDKINEKFRDRQVISNYGKRIIHVIGQIDFQTKLSDLKVHQGDTKSGKILQISLVDYYRTKYHIQVTNLNQPLIKTKSNKPVYLLPQFMQLVVRKKQMQQDHFRKIYESKRTKPQQYAEKNSHFLSNIHEPLTTNAFTKLKQIGIALDQQYTIGKAYLFEYPTIEAAQGQIVQMFKGNQFYFQDHKIYASEAELNICFIYPNELYINSILEQTKNISYNKGLKCQIKPFTYLAKPAQETLSQIKQIIYLQKLYQQRINITNIFWIIINDELQHLYSQIKALTFNCNIESSSQITLFSTFNKANLGKILTTIVQQMAAKIGNPIWKVKVPGMHGILLIGIAVQDGIITFSSNINTTITQFYSDFVELKPNQSLSMNIKSIVKTCLEEYIVRVEAFPTEVVILRFENKASKQEQDAQVRQIKSVLSSINNIEFGINYYSVCYSHSLNVYIQKDNSLGKPLQGMVINQHIVSDGSFYILNDNDKTKETVIVHYRSIYRNSYFRGFSFQQFLYDQTFNYYNFHGSVFIPGVLKLAKKLGRALTTYKCDKHAFRALSYNLYFL